MAVWRRLLTEFADPMNWVGPELWVNSEGAQEGGLHTKICWYCDYDDTANSGVNDEWVISDTGDLGPQLSVDTTQWTQSWYEYNGKCYWSNGTLFLWWSGSAWIISSTLGVCIAEEWDDSDDDSANHEYVGNVWWSKVDTPGTITGTYEERGQNRGSDQTGYEGTAKDVTVEVSGDVRETAGDTDPAGEYADGTIIGTDTGIVVDWPISEDGGSITEDASGNDNDGTLGGDTYYSAGKLIFDGDTDRVALSTALENSVWSMEAVLTHDSTGPDRVELVGEGPARNTLLFYYDLQRIYIKNKDGNLSGAISINLLSDTQQKVLLVANGTALSAYLDGALEGSVNIDTTFAWERFGRGNTASTGYDYKGSLHSLRYWNTNRIDESGIQLGTEQTTVYAAQIGLWV